MALLFSDLSSEVVAITSYDAKENEQRYVRDCLIQTDPRVFASRSTQLLKRKHVEAQTQETGSIDKQLVPLNHPSLLAFLTSVESDIFSALEENLNTDHFAGYDVDWNEETDAEVTCVETFYALASAPDVTNFNVEESSENSTDFFSGQKDSKGRRAIDSFDHHEGSQSTTSASISWLSWNTQGTLFAAATAHAVHEDWCLHKSQIVLWNVDRSKIDPKKPHNTLECTGCLTSLAFHPSNPSLLAAGSFNGEVFIFDLSKDENSQLIVNVASLHTEPISTVLWVRDPESNLPNAPYMLASAGQDGKILLSSLDERNKQLTLLSGQVLLAESLSSSKQRSAMGDATLGVTVMGTFSQDQTSFIVGSETGGLFKCSFTYSTKNRIVHSIMQQDVQFSSAAQLSLFAHSCPVTHVSTCPFHRNIVATCSTDATLRIYNVLQAEPSLTLRVGDAISCIDWSPFRPMVLAAVTQTGKMLLFDLVVNKSDPVLAIPLNPKSKVTSQQAGTFVKFNASRKDMVLTGDSSAQIKLWKLSSQFTHSREMDELFQLEKLCAVQK